MNKPICQQCEKEGKKYRVEEPLYGTTTLMSFTPGYWDEEGEYHPPFNPNKTTYEYHCSNGHKWVEETK